MITHFNVSENLKLEDPVNKLKIMQMKNKLEIITLFLILLLGLLASGCKLTSGKTQQTINPVDQLDYPKGACGLVIILDS